MRKISYGIYAEDEANKIFVTNTIQQLVLHLGYKEKLTFEREEEFTAMAVAKSSDFIVETFTARCITGIRRFDLEICFVCLDCEDRDYKKTTQKMFRAITHHGLSQNQVVISIAVQSIEYWLWYLKVKNENALLTETPKIETSTTRAEMKTAIYGSKRATNKVSNPIVGNLSQNIDFEWLICHSESFNDFYKQIETLLQNISN